MNRAEIFNTLYFTDSPVKKRPSNPQNWLTKYQRFTGKPIAKAFFGPREETPMYIEIDAQSHDAHAANIMMWALSLGIIARFVDNFDASPFTIETAGKAMATEVELINTTAPQN